MREWKYILDAKGEPVLEPELMKWAEWYEARDQRTDWIVANTQIGTAEISTVFLALDHNHWGDGPPILYETMVFDASRKLSVTPNRDNPGLSDITSAGTCHGWQDRYSTLAEAQSGHAAMCARVRSAQDGKES